MSTFRPQSAEHILAFSLEQHQDIGDYVEQTGRELEASSITPSKYEQSYRLTASQAAESGLLGLQISSIRDPISGGLATEAATISVEDEPTGTVAHLSYLGQKNIWELAHPSLSKPRALAPSQAADFLMRRPKHQRLLHELLDSTDSSSTAIIQSLHAHVKRSRITPQREQRLYQFAWPTRSIQPDGTNDATMHYAHTETTTHSRHSMAIASIHNTDTHSEATNLSLHTHYRLEHEKTVHQQRLVQGIGAVTLMSTSLANDTLVLLAQAEANQITEHYERLKYAHLHMRDIAFDSLLQPLS